MRAQLEESSIAVQWRRKVVLKHDLVLEWEASLPSLAVEPVTQDQGPASWCTFGARAREWAVAVGRVEHVVSDCDANANKGLWVGNPRKTR